MSYLQKMIWALGIFSLFLTSCSSDDDNDTGKVVGGEIPNEEEVINYISYTLTPQGGGTEITLTFLDEDGEGVGVPVLSVSGDLQVNTVYNGVIRLENRLATPVENVTEEILEEDEDHQFFFLEDSAGMTIAYADQDDNGKPLGVKTTLTTGATNESSITLAIRLRHELNKSAAGISISDAVDAGGVEEVDIAFEVSVVGAP